MTPLQMDNYLWNQGLSAAPFRGRKTPVELDFLRGFHQKPTLYGLRNWLMQQTGVPMRITSVWLDKVAWVRPEYPLPGDQSQELADLAVVLRRPGSGRPMPWAMWLLQGKVTDTPGQALNKGSSKKEIHLFENMSPFYFGRALRVGHRFELLRDFGHVVSTYCHWSFLCFKSPDQAKVTPTDLVQTRWTGSISPHPVVTDSFAGNLLRMVRDFTLQQPRLSFGAYLDPMRYAEWTLLAQQMLLLSRHNGHARSADNLDGCVLVRAAVAQCLEQSSASALMPFYDHPHARAEDFADFYRLMAFAEQGVFLDVFSTGHPESTERDRQRLDDYEAKRIGMPDLAEPPPPDPPIDGSDNDQEGDSGPTLTLFIDIDPKD